MQQKIIDVLDTADRVHIVGTNGNRTDLYVKIHELKEPSKETAFENLSLIHIYESGEWWHYNDKGEWW